jgi:hypothetical protein
MFINVIATHVVQIPIMQLVNVSAMPNRCVPWFQRPGPLNE